MAHRRHRTPHHAKASHWPDRSRRQQRSAWIALRWRIRQNAQHGASAVYQARHVEDANPEPLSWQWTDIVVPDPDGHTIWNMALVTVRKACWEAVDTLANDAVDARMTDEEREDEMDRFSLDQMFRPIPGSSFFEFVSRPAPRHASLNGMTVREAEAAEVARIFAEGPPAQGETWTLHRDYRYGIGVHAQVGAPLLDRAHLEAFVQRFLAQRGQPPVPPTPVPAEWLPTQSEDATYAAAALNPILAQSHPVS